MREPTKLWGLNLTLLPKAPKVFPSGEAPGFRGNNWRHCAVNTLLCILHNQLPAFKLLNEKPFSIKQVMITFAGPRGGTEPFDKARYQPYLGETKSSKKEESNTTKETSNNSNHYKNN